MTAGNNYITANCIIRGNKITGNGQTVFEDPAPDAFGFLEAAYRQVEMNYPKFFKMDKLSKLGLLATEILLRQGFDKEKYAPEKTGIVLSNVNASLDADAKYFDSVKNIPSPALFVYTLPNIVIGEICIRHHFKGENAFFITERFDADLLYFYVNELFRHHRTEACIAGWADIVGEEYEAVLCLVEKEKNARNELFTTASLQKLYATDHG